MSWTGDRVATLKKLWADGHSASTIATKLGEVTRNAVIGKVHRLGLAGRKSGARKTALPMAGFPFRAAKTRTQTPFIFLFFSAGSAPPQDSAGKAAVARARPRT